MFFWIAMSLAAAAAVFSFCFVALNELWFTTMFLVPVVLSLSFLVALVVYIRGARARR